MSFEGINPYSLPQLKIQMLEELLLDDKLSDREFRLAAALILKELKSFDVPTCTTDEHLSEYMGGRSADTMSRAVQALEKSPHFEIKRGARNRATEYQISRSLQMAAISRKAQPVNSSVEPESSTPQICGTNPSDVQGTTPQICTPILKDKNIKKNLDSKIFKIGQWQAHKTAGSHCSKSTVSKPFEKFPSFGGISDNPFWRGELTKAWPDWSPRSNNSCTKAIADRVRKLAGEQEIPLDDPRMAKLFSNVVGRWKK